MRNLLTVALVLAAVLAVATPTRLLADYYESFDSNDLWGPDPNYWNLTGITGITSAPPPLLANFDANYSWEIDNPQWWIYKLMCNANTSFADANAGAVRMYQTAHPYAPVFGLMAVLPDDNNPDPNTSNAYWDDTTNHYVLTKVYYPGYYGHQNDPNYDRGNVVIVMHAHPSLWTSLCFSLCLHSCAYQNGDPNIPLGYERERYWSKHFSTFATQGTNPWNIQRLDIEPNGMRAEGSLDPATRDPNDLCRLNPPETSGNYRMPEHNGDPNWKDPNFFNWDQMERDGFWMLMQFERDPNHAPGDPNGKYLRGAIWPGDKYDWNGQWMLSYHLADPWWSGDHEGWYYSTGRTALMSLTGTPGDPGYGAGFPGDVVFDDIEARTDIFNGVPRLLDLKVVKSQYMTSIKVAPSLPDPNDPNTLDERYYRFTDGTPIVMTATPISGKAFRDWMIWSDPSKYPDANHAVVDANAVLHLVMDGDKIVEATFKCGSGVEPLIGIGLFVLALAAVVRRLT